ncbi:MAG: pre-peptidase C-terminal domain-containing protein [Chloroflexi bacterium]|nr:pre-peptidase C-terminal domain-containing protein [Chloroflexota bacterium]
MKQYSLVFVVLLLLAMVWPALAQDLGETLEWPEYGLTIDYPDRWTERFYSGTNSYYAMAEEEADLDTLSLDPEGQFVVILPVEGPVRDNLGEDPEGAVANYGEANIDGFRARDVEQIDIENGYDTFWGEGDGTAGGYIVVAAVVGPDETIFLFIAVSPPRDSRDLADNVRAMLDTLELSEVETDIVENGRADDATPIAYGETAEGEITNRTFAEEYVFEGNAGDIVTISMVDTSRQGTLDPLVILIGQNGREIARNDDHTEGDLPNALDSQITEFELPEDGVYLIIATRFQGANGSSTGDYELTLDAEVSEPTPDAPEIEGEVLLDEEGNLTNRAYSDEFTFEASAGDIVTITMLNTDDSLDAQVILLDPNGDEIARNDDADRDADLPDRSDAQIAEFQLPEAGEYTVIATRAGEADGSTRGDYRITVVLVGTGEVATQEASGFTVNDDGDDLLEYGETVQGEINDDTFRVTYDFEGTEGDIVTITMIDVSEDNGLDPLLILLDEGGNELARNDDASNSAEVGQFNSQIANFTLPATGTYTVVATRFSEQGGNTAGEFIVSLELSSGEDDGGK